MKKRWLNWAGIPAVTALLPMAVMADGVIQTNETVLTLALKGNCQDILWVSLGTADPQLMSVIVAMLVFGGVIWFVMGGKKQ